MAPLTQAISQGFSADQIIQYLLRHFPKYSKEINKALAKGFSASQILQYLDKGRKGFSDSPDNLTEHEKTRKSDIDKQKNLERNIGKGALAIGGAALGAYGLAQRGSSILPEVLPALQGVSQPKEDVEIDLTPKIAHQPRQLEQQPPNQLIQQATAPQPPVSPPQAPINPSQQPQMSQSPQVDFGQILDQLGVKSRIDAMRQQNPPDIVAKAIRYGLPKSQLQQIESQLQMPIDQIVEGYIASAPPIETMKEKITKGVDVTRQPKAEPSINAGSSVLLPDGQLGEIEDVKKGIAKVKIGDKIRHKKLDELMESPKEAANAALELIKSFTPESKRSAHHALSTYDPTTRSAQFLFHNGEGYIVDDISPEEYEKLSNEVEEAKTSGQNKIGAWATGAGSRGAAYQKIVKNLKKPYRKIVVGYNLFKELQSLINEKE